MLDRTLEYVPANSAWRARLKKLLDGDQDCVGVHLAVFVEPFLSAILDGRKTIESRFALHRCAPYQRVELGDVILLKRSRGPVVGIARAGRPDYYQLGPGDLEQIRTEYAEELFALDDEFWESRVEKRYATLIVFQETARIDDMPFEKRDRRGWVSFSKTCEAPHPLPA